LFFPAPARRDKPERNDCSPGIPQGVLILIGSFALFGNGRELTLEVLVYQI
jgi:hypothetical protein